jgi:hypothetical protein
MAVGGPLPGPAVTVPANTQVTIDGWKDNRYLGSVVIGKDDMALVEVTSSDMVGRDATLDSEVIRPDQAKAGQFARGDLVVFGKYNGFAHVAIATGLTAGNGSPTLYSLWDNREIHPIIDDIPGICANSALGDVDHPVVTVRTAAPAWYLRD